MLQTMLMLSVVLHTTGFHPTPFSDDAPKIRQVITNFSLYADQQDADAMDAILDSSYRIVLNRLFGSTEVGFMDKATYLQMLRDKQFGGDRRSVTIYTLDINGNNAMVKATFAGQQMTTTNYLLLAKTEQGHWRIVSDMPTVE
ncbi:MAG TPA: nuclear transport factor 2 family protein [Saprospiraceae bacterium]|nr:nuclear transport factor 2 family protein [Saprospiraceae bacterium]HMP25114.1 nuclear transport factor 2 family protein [Saprospiraceae bacterium]